MNECFHYSCVTCRDFSKLFNNPKFSDVKIYTKEQILLVNSILISEHSSVLKDKLLVGEKDIILDEFMEEEETVKIVFQAMYHRDGLLITPEAFAVLIKIALALDVGWIVTKCVEFAKKNLSPETVVMYSETGMRMTQYFLFNDLLDACVEYIQNTEQLFDLVVAVEQLDMKRLCDNFIKGLLKNNKVSRDETRMGKILLKWLEVTAKVEVTYLLSLVNLEQIYAGNKAFHTELFSFLIGLDLSSNDRKIVLEMSMNSLAEGQLVARVNTFQDSGSMETNHILEFVKSDTWTDCTFEQFMQLRKYGGFEEHIFIELYLAWARVNVSSTDQLESFLNSIDLSMTTREYTADLIAHINQHGAYTDNATAKFEQKLINALQIERKIGEFTRQIMTKGNLKSLQSKKHTVTKRPCCVQKCKNKTLGCIDMKLTRDSLPFYKIAKFKTTKTSLEHPHNTEFCHAYFLVNNEIVSCVALPWPTLREKLNSTEGQVTFVVIHKHIQ